jgi:hypothetical protein
MRQQSTLIFALVLSALSAGCVGTGPNTQQGAVTGATLGAIAGGIIGNNSGHQTWEGAALGALAGAIAGGTIGNSVDNQNGTLYRPPPAASNMVVRQMPAMPPPPPTPTAEAVTPPPSSSAVWIPGYSAYDGYRNVWVAGHWEIPPPNCRTYVAPYWVNQGGAYTFIPGSWR